MLLVSCPDLQSGKRVWCSERLFLSHGAGSNSVRNVNYCIPPCTAYSLVPTLRTPPGETVWWTKSNFLGLFPKMAEDQWDCKIANYYVVLPLQLQNLFISIRVSILFWAGFPQSILSVARLHCALAQQIQLGPPDCFSSWEGGVWGRDYTAYSVPDGSTNDTKLWHLYECSASVQAASLLRSNICL